MNPFDSIQLDPVDVKQVYNKKPDKNPFDQMEVDESWGTSVVRWLSQIPAGIASAITWPAEIVKMMGVADATDPEEIEHLRKISEREGVPFDEEKYMDAVQQASDIYPTQHNIERGVEHYTGLPLEPKTRGQKALRFLSTAGKLIPKGSSIRGVPVALPRPVTAAGLTAAKEGVQELGVPEPLAEIGAFGLVGMPPKNAPTLTGIGTKKKPSGMIERRFESLEKPTKVSAEKKAQIGEKVEGDFRKILDDLVESSPIGETVKELAENPKYRKSIEDKFEKVHELSGEIPETFSTKEIKKDLLNKVKSDSVTPSEYESSYQKFMANFAGKTKVKDISAKNLVDQFRKNNQALSEIFESGQSGAYNRAKKDAYLDYNRILADKIENKFPKSEFSDLFKESNFQWSKIKDAEFVESFMDDMFEGKINFKKGEKAFNKKESQQFKKALGKEAYERFETLMEDLLSAKEGYSKLKIASNQGFPKLASTGIAYLLHPKLAAAKLGKDLLHKIYDFGLDKPKFSFTWKEGIDAFKKGNYAKAESKFSLLDKEIKESNQKQSEQ